MLTYLIGTFTQPNPSPPNERIILQYDEVFFRLLACASTAGGGYSQPEKTYHNIIILSGAEGQAKYE